MSSRNNPFEELEQLFDRMSRQFEEASRSWSSGTPFASRESEDESMALDLVEHDDEYVVTVDLPGFEREDVDVRVTDSTLKIAANREQAVDEEDGEFIRHERRHRRASRSVRLPEPVDANAVTARMRHGVLTVTVPREDVEDSTRIEIEEA
ncbi:Hsp20/alpha crystallin family protein [Halorubellus salinus]|uniref:Hsp20/alpha crystallin family protein n=1 Tax=Halorubellus salinus TaxID=755309 RepID=UPI001D060E0C|nr:Hsp20/alpha crystallin family protein [Halorubellus salinus]